MINMDDANTEVLAKELPWYKLWFDTVHYHKLYRRHDEKEAEYFIDNLLIKLKPIKNSSMLDVGCGAGRHSRYLALKGFQVTGIDLSFNNIREANKFKNDNLRFYRHDMRIPFGKEYFDYVFNFFTSFGYFKTHFENNSVIKNISAALKPGGKLVLDYLNTYYAKKQLILNEEKDIDGTVFHLTRWIDEKHFFKKIRINDMDGKPLEYVEQVAMFTLDDFRKLYEANNLFIKEYFGDYDLSKFNSECSKRLIITAQKND